MARGVLDTLKILETRSLELLEEWERDYDSYFKELDNVVPKLQQLLDQNDNVSLPPLSSVGRGKQVTRLRSAVHKNTSKRDSTAARKSSSVQENKKENISNISTNVQRSLRKSSAQENSLQELIKSTQRKRTISQRESIGKVRKSLANEFDLEIKEPVAGSSTDEGPVRKNPSIIILESSVTTTPMITKKLFKEEFQNDIQGLKPEISGEKSSVPVRPITRMCSAKDKTQKADCRTPTVKIVTKASKHRKGQSNITSAVKLGKLSSLDKKGHTSCDVQDTEGPVAKKIALLKSKVEETKKKREEKAMKNLIARQQIEKEKEMQRAKIVEQSMKKALTFKKNLDQEVDKKSKCPSEPKQPESNDLVEEINKAKEDCCIVASTPKTTCDDKNVLNATYIAKSKSDVVADELNESYVNYEMSELRDSDSEGDDEPTKPVPKWASGLRLKETLLKQFYDHPNAATIFGRIVISPTETFGFRSGGKKLQTRNSSAIWNTTDMSFI